MALTTHELIKVFGGAMQEMGAEGEAFEDAHPGEKKKWSKTEIVEKLVKIGKELGTEILD